MARLIDDVTASAQVRNGKLYIRNRRDFDQLVAQMRDGQEVEVSVTRRRSTRSHEANAYYWGVVIAHLERHFSAHDLGYTADDIHELCKAKFIPKRVAVCKGNGEVVGDFVLGGSTRKLNTSEFYDYIEQIRQWAAELDCYIPDPNESEAA